MLGQNHQYIQILCLTLVCKLWMSCGAQQNHERTPVPDRDLPEFTLIEPANYYFKQDGTCDPEENQSISIDRATVYSADSTGLTNEPRELIGAKSGRSFTTPAINETFYGGIYEADCHEHEVANCQNKYLSIRDWKIIRDRSPLNICQPQGSYKRLSYEGMALSVAYSLQNASTVALRNISNLSLAPVSLQLMPQFRVRRRSLQLRGQEADGLIYATHQMSYAVNEKSIIVYPEKADLPIHQPQFWESPFVISHEFGHHIEASIKRQIMDEQDIETFKEFTEDDGSVERKADKALSEAFADLLSYYTLNESPLALAEFPRDFHDRNPRNTVFSDGKTEKILDEYALGVFNNNIEARDPSQYVNLSRMHLIGAILAHNLDKLFTLMSAATVGNHNDIENANTSEKYGYVVSWFTEFSKIKLAALKQATWSEIDTFELFRQSLDKITAKHQADFKNPESLNQTLCITYSKQLSALPVPAFCK